MRVLQISHYNHIIGGSDAVFFATSDLLENAGHDVVRFCMDHPDNLPSPWAGYFPKGADTRTAPLGDTLRYFYNSQARKNLKRLLQDVGPVDVAHLHIYHGKQTPAILPVLRAHGIPIVQSLHEYKLACPVYTLQRNGTPCEDCVTGSPLNALRYRCKDGSLLRSAVMLAEMASARILGDVRLVDRFICVSDFQRRIMERAGLPQDKLTRLHNFVDQNSSGIPSGHGGYLLYIGRIEELKGISTLVSVARNTGHRLVIAGTGGWTEDLQSKIKGYPNIDYVGFQKGQQLHQLISRARAVVVPSQWYENCPMSVLEAKALGRPIIGAAIGGIPELVRDGVDGFLFAPGDETSLTQALGRLDRADHARLSTNAVQDAAIRFSAETHLDALLSIYQGVSRHVQASDLMPA